MKGGLWEKGGRKNERVLERREIMMVERIGERGEVSERERGTRVFVD